MFLGILFALLNVLLRYLTDRDIFVENDCAGNETSDKCVIYWTAVVLSVIFAVALDLSYILLFACRKQYDVRHSRSRVNSIDESMLENPQSPDNAIN